jgi:hypothetical protein
MSAAVHRDDPIILGEVFYDRFPNFSAGSKRMNENDRLSLSGNNVPNLDAARIQKLVRILGRAVERS